jgi:hypothetical protein
LIGKKRKHHATVLTILGLYCLTDRGSEGLMRSHIPPACAFRKLAPSAIASLFLCDILSVVGCAVANHSASINGDYRIVERAIDGHTLVMANGERVRLIGVDTPEIKHPNKPVEHFGKEAAAFTRQMTEGKRVRWELDSAQRKDRYGRILAYVFLEDAQCLTPRSLSRVTASLTPGFRLRGWKSLGARASGA